MNRLGYGLQIPTRYGAANIPATGPAGGTVWSGADIAGVLSNVLGAGADAYVKVMTAQLMAKQNAGVDIQAILRDRDRVQREIADAEARIREKRGGDWASLWPTFLAVGVGVLAIVWVLKKKK